MIPLLYYVVGMTMPMMNLSILGISIPAGTVGILHFVWIQAADDENELFQQVALNCDDVHHKYMLYQLYIDESVVTSMLSAKIHLLEW